ncbi:MAG: ABC transporter ATP-binding protein [Spirochaetota bacterium]
MAKSKYYVDRGLWANALSYLSYFKAFRAKAAWAVVLYIIKYLPFASYPVIVKLVVDSYIPLGEIDKIIGSLWIIAVFGVLNIIYHAAFEAVRIDVVKSISREVRNTIIHKLQILSLKYHSLAETGRMYSKIMVDVGKVEMFGEMMFHMVLPILVGFTYSVIILAIVNVRIMLVLFILIPLLAVVQKLFKNTLSKLQYIGRTTNEDLSAAVSTFLQTSMLVRVHGEEKYQQANIDTKSRTVVTKYRDIAFKVAAFGASNSMTTQLFQFALVIMLAVAVIRKEVLIGEMFLFLNFANQIIGHVSQVVNQYTAFLEFSEAMNSINEILSAPDTEMNEGKRRISSVKGEIVFDHVWFGFEEGVPLLKDISVRIESGKTVALVGASGAGKTTFANMVLGLYRPDKGVIRIDDASIDDVDMRSVRQYMGVVTQEPILFTGTVEENISHALKVHTTYEMIEAAKKAKAHEFIMQLPERYKTVIGERGSTLSGGQRQRIAIARAILRDPSILILDEATSALDAESEEEIKAAIDQMLGNQTTIIIAHRLSTVMNADVILVFRDGKIVESGTHKDLVAKNGDYARLVSIQLGGAAGEA